MRRVLIYCSVLLSSVFIYLEYVIVPPFPFRVASIYFYTLHQGIWLWYFIDAIAQNIFWHLSTISSQWHWASSRDYIHYLQSYSRHETPWTPAASQLVCLCPRSRSFHHSTSSMALSQYPIDPILLHCPQFYAPLQIEPAELEHQKLVHDRLRSREAQLWLLVLSDLCLVWLSKPQKVY